jgi:hypothetical protein
MTDEATNQFLERVRASLDERSQRVRPQMAARLRSARSEAINSRPQPIFRGWIPAMASAFAVVMAVAIWFGNTQDIPRGQPVEQLVYNKQAVDVVMLAEADGNGLKLMQDLEFYAWLEQEERRNS